MRVLLAIIVLSTGWAMDRGGPSRSGVSPVDIDPPLRIESTLQLEGAVTASPVVKDGKIIIGTTSGNLYCVDLNSLAIDWTSQNKGGFRSAALVGDGVCITGDTSGNVLCRSLKDGNTIWGPVNYGEWVNSSPLPDGDLIIFGANDRKVHALNAKTGEKSWSSEELRGQVQAGITKSGKNYIVGCFGQPESENNYDPGNIYALNEKGEIVWGPKITKGSVQDTSAVSDNQVYVTSHGYSWEDNKRPKGRISCLNADSGLTVWQRDLGNEIWGSPAVKGNYVVIGSRDHFVWCFNSATGDEVWHVETGSLVDGSPVISGDYCYIGGLDGLLYVIELGTGKIFQTLKVGELMDGIQGSVAIANDYLVCISSSGLLHRFGLAPRGKIFCSNTTISSRSGQYGFSLAITNTTRGRKQNPKEPLKVKFGVKSDWLKFQSDEIAVIPSATKTIYISGNVSLPPGQYTAEIFIQESNCPTLKFETMVNKKAIESDTLILTLNVLKVNMANLSVREEQINLGAIWDDDVIEQAITISNFGEATLTGKIVLPPGFSANEMEFEIEGGDKKVIPITFTPPKGKLGDYWGQIKVFSNGGEETVDITAKIWRSKLVVKVAIGSKEALVNGEPKPLNAAPYIKQGSTMVPVRVVSEGLDLGVTWDASLKTVVVNLTGGRYLRLIVGYGKAVIEEPDGKIFQVELSVSPEIKSGTTFVPLRFIADNLSSSTLKTTVEWSASERSATVTRPLKPKIVAH